jgi:hypothetical protein
MTPGSASSTDRAVAGGTSIQMFAHKIIMVVNGRSKLMQAALETKHLKGECPIAIKADHLQEHNNDLGKVATQKVNDKLDDVVVDTPAFFHSRNNGDKVVVCQHDVGSLLCDFGAGLAHGDANVRLFDCGCVVDSVTGLRSRNKR